MAYTIVERYGRIVWEDTGADQDRKTGCMCLNCKNINICPLAEAGFALCKHFGNAFKMTRCGVLRDRTLPATPENLLFEPKK